MMVSDGRVFVNSKKIEQCSRSCKYETVSDKSFTSLSTLHHHIYVISYNENVFLGKNSTDKKCFRFVVASREI